MWHVVFVGDKQGNYIIYLEKTGPENFGIN